MSGKSTELYMRVFEYIENNIFNLNPAQFMTDFEAGLRKAINKYYPHAILHGCWYHFCAAIRRQLLSLNLYELTMNEPIAKAIYRQILSLPLLPPESILSGYNVVKTVARNNKLYQQFKPMFEYFNSYWIAMVRFARRFSLLQNHIN